MSLLIKSSQGRSASSSSVSVWYSLWLKQPPAWHITESSANWPDPQEQLNLQSVLHPHMTIPTRDNVLGVRGTWLVANFVTTHFLLSSESSRAVKYRFRISLLFESWSFLEHTPYTSMSPGFKHWLAWLIGFSCHLQLTQRWIFLQSGQKCQIFCHFHQEIGGVYSSLSDDSIQFHD